MKKIILDTSKVEFSRNDLKRNIILPIFISTALAEDIGIHIGDGSINYLPNIDYECKCSGNPENEKEWYDNFIVPLKRKIFNIKVKARNFSDGTYGIRLRSKAIIQFYNKVIGLPVGYKSSFIEIPELVLKSSKEIQIACLRGIFDADGSLTFKKKTKNRINFYPVISFSTRSKILRNQISAMLKTFNFKFCKCDRRRLDKRTKKIGNDYEIYISGKNNLLKWFNLVSSNNPNHTTKFLIFKQFGFCPVKTSLRERIKILETGFVNKFLNNGPGEI